MIISHAHRYVFVELPRTGSTAVRQELRDHYAGEPILWKHATYEDFLRQASPDERSYFAFSGIRNPLDDAVSRYFKLRTDHRGQFTGAGRKSFLVRLVDEHQYRFIERGGVGFPAFFLRYYHVPYDTWASLSHDRLDHIIRFERLAEDFAEALHKIGIEPVRDLPIVNRTTERDPDYRIYYPPETRARARRVFGPYMSRWGYELPAEWGLEPPSQLQWAGYRAVSALSGIYWRYVRPRLGPSVSRTARSRRRRSSRSGS